MRRSPALALDHAAIEAAELLDAQARLEATRARLRTPQAPAALPGLRVPAFVTPQAPAAVPPQPPLRPGYPPPRLRRCGRCPALCWVFGQAAPACSACAVAQRQEDRAALLGACLASVPALHREARLDAATWARLDRPRVLELSPLGQIAGETPLTLSAARKLPGLVSTGRPVLLLGPAGSGKTTLACALLLDLHQAGLSLDAPGPVVGLAQRARFLLADTLARATDESGLGGLPAAVEDALGASVLVLDELGAEPDSLRSHVGRVVHQRHGATCPTIATSGFPLPKLRARYGTGIERRLTEGAVVIALGDLTALEGA